MAILGLLVFTGCSHVLMHGSVVLMRSDTEAQVCLGDRRVAAGDEVDLVRYDCLPTPGVKLTHCKRLVRSRGVVRRTLDEHYALVDFPAGTQLAQGDAVEVNVRTAQVAARGEGP
jgi:hypothetical protein